MKGVADHNDIREHFNSLSWHTEDRIIGQEVYSFIQMTSANEKQLV